MKYYMTMREARGALSLDTGFDPFISDGWGRCTKAKLADHGYVVDRKRAEEIDRGHNCQMCQEPVEQEYDGVEYYYPTHCPEHKKFTFGCDNGHRWQATTAEDDAANHKCPTCGEYWQ